MAWKRAGPAEAEGGGVEGAMLIRGDLIGEMRSDLVLVFVQVVLRSRMEEVYERNPSSPRRRRNFEATARPAKIALELHVEVLTLSSAFEFVVSYFFDVGLLTYKLQSDTSYLPRLAIWTCLIGVSIFMVC